MRAGKKEKSDIFFFCIFQFNRKYLHWKRAWMGYSFPFFAAFLCVWSSTSRADAPRDLDRWGFCDARDRGWKLSLHLPLAPHSAHRLDVNDSSTYADACIKKNISVSNIQSIRSSITPKKSINHFTDRSRGDIINNEYTPLLINHT